MVALLSLLAYLLNAFPESADAASQSQETEESSVNDVIHYECMIDIFVYSLYRSPQVRKISGKLPTLYFFGNLQP